MDEYIRKQDAVDVFNRAVQDVGILDADDIETVFGMLSPADVVPVVHGRWKKIGVWGRVYRCNQCGNFLDFDGVNAGRGDANFCPNCGVKMDVR